MIENKLQGGYATDMDEYAKSIIPIIEANYEKYTETERYRGLLFKAGKTGAAVGRTSVERAFRFRGVAVTFCKKMWFWRLPGVHV